MAQSGLALSIHSEVVAEDGQRERKAVAPDSSLRTMAFVHLGTSPVTSLRKQTADWISLRRGGASNRVATSRRRAPRHAYVHPVPYCAASPEGSGPGSEVPTSDAAVAPEVPFEIRGFSLANFGLLLGFAITGVSFSSYFQSSGTASATSLGFVYGVPVLLIGCALKYAELKPVPVTVSDTSAEAREKRGTAIQKKIFRDITRHRYGDEAHLAAALSSLGLVPRGEPCPVLIRASESDRGGEYSLLLEFYSVATPFKAWVERVERFERFFGPGVSCEVEKLDSEKRMVGLRLTSTATAEADA